MLRLPPQWWTSYAALGVMALACHHGTGGSAGQAEAEPVDSVRGKVQVVGVEALPTITLAPDGGRPAVTLIGPPSLRRVEGLTVIAIGRLAGSKLTVQEFTVVAANGVPATDGRLVAEGAALYLETADRVRHRLVQPSPRLWAEAGRRVWVSGPLDHEPVAYGIIE
jgi:hypothetical protein